MKNSLRIMVVLQFVLLIICIGLVEILLGFLFLESDDAVTVLKVIFTGMVIAVLGVVILIPRYLKPLDRFLYGINDIVNRHFSGNYSNVASENARETDRTFKDMLECLEKQNKRLEELTSKISETERLVALGQLAAGVAHELNNPLGGIVVYSHLLREDTAPDDPRIPNIEKIIKESIRCKNIVRSLLDFARQSHPVLEHMDVNRTVKEALNNICNERVFDNITLVENYDETLPKVLADSSQIQEVCENIIRNAAEVMQGSGELKITSRLARDEQDNHMLEIVFEDSGPGIPDEHIEHIFDPFYTTKVKGHGTGLGLAVSYGIMERHEGTITVSNRPCGGALFSVRLPIERNMT